MLYLNTSPIGNGATVAVEQIENIDHSSDMVICKYMVKEEKAILSWKIQKNKSSEGYLQKQSIQNAEQ